MRPLQSRSRIHHCPRQRNHFRQRHMPCRAGSDERGQMYVGVSTRRDILNDGTHCLLAQRLAEQLGAHATQRFQLGRVTDGKQITVRRTESLPCPHRQARFIDAQQIGIDDI